MMLCLLIDLDHQFPGPPKGEPDVSPGPQTQSRSIYRGEEGKEGKSALASLTVTVPGFGAGGLAIFKAVLKCVAVIMVEATFLLMGIWRGLLNQTGDPHSPLCLPNPWSLLRALPATEHKHLCPSVTCQLCCLVSCGERAFQRPCVSCLALLPSLSHLSDLWSSTLS